ncbi:diacylglycerol/lipid kinase family protein [Prosthecomicrobium pneumaticum]|uniref:Diacylglycerol kinase family enzyme n=1 Tax=Prosthecomicrobium pneumaticum TaxID=81895 RepID=A0A7W9FLG5_9HYPH|nr:diacylglycerol kinase family protein [Prosthecomicrobium pneumaticum]MBB5752854.1 diacylglycerol kinase family enzyme [Prosthecomicrobium pneumaticum]
MRDTAVVLNEKAGLIADLSPATVRQAIERAFEGSGHEPVIELVPGREIVAAIDRAAASDARYVVVGGGDGSVSHAVRALAGTDKVLGVLPLGTLNLFGRDIGMPATLDAMLAAAARAEPKRLDLAAVNGRLFHSVSGLGFFAEIARAREQVRGSSLPFGRFVAVARSSVRAFLRAGVLELALEAEGERREIEAYAVLVTNNRFGSSAWDRPRLDEGVIEVHFARGREVARRIQAGVDLISGRWRDNPEIESIVTTRLTIESRRPRLWLAVDGEIRRAETPLVYEARPAAITVLVPRPAEAAA